MKHEMSEQVKETRERCEAQARETNLQNSEFKRELEELKQVKLIEKTNFSRKISD